VSHSRYSRPDAPVKENLAGVTGSAVPVGP